MSARDVLHDFFHLHWASPLINLVYLLDWVFYTGGVKTFKTYIKTNLTNGFIQPLKSPTSAFILFVHKPDDSLHLCVNY